MLVFSIIYAMYSLPVRTRSPQSTCGGEMAAFTSWFSPASTGDPGTNRRSDSKQLSCLTPSLSSVFLKLHYFFTHFTHLYLQLCVCMSTMWIPSGQLALSLVIFFNQLCVCVYAPRHMYGGQRTAYGRPLSPAPWILGTHAAHQRGGKCPYPRSHLTGPFCFLFKKKKKKIIFF